MNSPESTRPCHAVPENWNGTLDIAASGWERNAPRVHGAPLGNGWGNTAIRLATTPLSGCPAKKWLSGRVPPERLCQR